MVECAYLQTHISEDSHYENGKKMIVVPECQGVREQSREQSMVPKGFVCAGQGRYCALHNMMALQKVP